MTTAHQHASSQETGLGSPAIVMKSFADLTGDDRAAWTNMRAANPALYSPYFHIDYTEEVAKLQKGVRVLCVYENDKAVGFLPIQGQNFARPAGTPMTDYHGFITAPDSRFDYSAALREAGIGAYHYYGLTDPDKLDHVQRRDGGSAFDISMGADAWRLAQGKSYRRHYKDYKRRVRRAEEDFGPVTFELQTQNEEVFETLIQWKREQFKDTGKYDVLGAGWTLDLLRALWQRGTDADLRCDLYAMRINGALAAIDLGLTDGKTYHSWIVSYDPKYHRYSPGTQLLEALIDHNETLGYDRIDMGVGLTGYKRYYSGLEVPVGVGFLAAKGPAALLSRAYGAVENLSENAPLGKVGKLPGKLRRRYTQIASCDPSAGGRAKAMLQAVRGAAKN